MSPNRSALIIANYQYSYPGFRPLLAPAQDAESLARVLSDPAICGFEVQTLVNQPSYKLTVELESFCDNRNRDDLLLLYFSGHGIKDADGQLYFATVDTQLAKHDVRRATAVAAHFVNQIMSRSRSRRQVLLIDCCYSGAFKHEMLSKSGPPRVGASEQLEGLGRVVLTASDAFQYSFEGGQIVGEGVRSVFTRILVNGLESGEADLDRDGLFSLDEVYDYAYSKILDVQPNQKPTKMGYVEGKLFIGSNPHPIPSKLPPELQESVDSRLHWVRLGAVTELKLLLSSSNRGLVLAAEGALRSLAAQDHDLRVRLAATDCLVPGTRTGFVPPLSPANHGISSEQERTAKENTSKVQSKLESSNDKLDERTRDAQESILSDESSSHKGSRSAFPEQETRRPETADRDRRNAFGKRKTSFSVEAHGTPLGDSDSSSKAEKAAKQVGHGASFQALPEGEVESSIGHDRISRYSRGELARLSAFCSVFFFGAVGAEVLVASVVSQYPQWWLYYFSGTLTGFVPAIIYSALMRGRQPHVPGQSVIFGLSWAIGWIVVAHSNFDPVAGLLGGAFVPLFARISWRRK